MCDRASCRYRQILQDDLDFDSEEWDDVSQLARDFITTLMDRNSHRRPRADAVLTHPWLANRKQQTIASSPVSTSANTTGSGTSTMHTGSSSGGGSGGGGGGGSGGSDTNDDDEGGHSPQWAALPVTKPLNTAQANLRKYMVRAHGG